MCVTYMCIECQMLRLRFTIQYVRMSVNLNHRLNMELDHQSLFGLHVHSCTHWLRPRTPPPRIWAHTRTRALLVSQERRHLFVNP